MGEAFFLPGGGPARRRSWLWIRSCGPCRAPLWALAGPARGERPALIPTSRPLPRAPMGACRPGTRRIQPASLGSAFYSKLNSIRRFFAFPAGFLLSAIGFSDP